MQSLVDKFRERIQQIDQKTEPQPEEKQKPEERRFNIFKRSLPAGVNKLVYHNVPESDVNALFKHFLRAKVLPNDTVLYWDAVAVDHPDAYNVYSNYGIETTVLEVLING